MRKAILLMFSIAATTLSAQKYMVVAQKGEVETRFPVERIDSVYFLGYEQLQDTTLGNIDFANTYVSAVESGNSNETNQNFAFGGYCLYAVGSYGIRKYDYTNPNQPILIAENRIRSHLTAKSVTLHDGYVYVTMRENTGGMDESSVPEVRFHFESGVEEYVDNKNGKICNDDRFNAFFKKLSLVSIDPAIINKIIVYKAYPKNGQYRNTILIAQAGGRSVTFASANFDTKDDAINALTDSYVDRYGNSCEVDWSMLAEGSIVNSDFQLTIPNLGSFDSYEQKGSAKIDELGIASPNRWVHSARLQTTRNTGFDSALLCKNLVNPTDEAYVSFWMNNSKSDKPIYLPIVGNEHDTIKVILKPTNSGYTVGLANGEVEYLGEKILIFDEWYNFKVHITPNGFKLFYSEKEMDEYKTILTTDLTNCIDTIDKLFVGLATSADNAVIYIDDFYYNQTDIDTVSYIVGGIAVLDENLNEQIFYSNDLKATQSFVKDGCLFVNYLCGFNLYNLNDPSRPKLASYHRTSSLKEYQGCSYYEHNGRTFAIMANYAVGFSIADITDMNDISIIKEYTFDPQDSSFYYNGIQRMKLWDVVVDYPYAYFAAAPNPDIIGTAGDFRGIVTFDLSSDSLSYTLSPIESQFYWNIMTNADRQPTHITQYDNWLMLNNEEQGFVVFDKTNKSCPSFKESVQVPGNSCVYGLRAFNNGYLFVGDGYSGNASYPDRNIYLFDLNKE